MKRTTALFLPVILILNLLSWGVANAEDTKQYSVSIPVSTGLIGGEYGAKSFELNLPSGMNPAGVIGSSLKYTGSNRVSSSPKLEGGKIKITLSGVAKNNTLQVIGTYGGKPFITNIGNSIWRYSDGRRWQINDYNPKTDQLESSDKPATDYGTPSEIVPKVVVNAASNQRTDGCIWKTDSGQQVDDVYVLTNTITPVTDSKSSWVTSVSYPNGRIITSYSIPIYPDDKFGWDDVTKTATMPITGHVQGRFYQAAVKYKYEATAKVPTYSYGGTITFNYKLPTEPTLTGEVNLIKPNPNPAQATGSDIPVTLSLKGTLAAYTDTSNIQEWVFYAKETGNDSSLLMKKDYSKALSSSQTFDFNIPKAKTTASNFTQDYSLTVTVRFSKPVLTSSGPITSLTENLTTKASTYSGSPPSNMPEPAPAPVSGKKPPIAFISMPGKIVAGKKFIVSGAYSNDPDGTIESYDWQHPNVIDALYGKSSDTKYGLDSIGTTQTITLTVTDDDGLTGTTSRDIEVVAPVPNARIEIKGTLKQNRKISLNNESTSDSDDFPIVSSKTKFTISAVSGGTGSDIKYNGSLIGVEDVDLLIKTPGIYRATIYVENTAGYSATDSRTFTVSPDEAPIPYISIPSGAYRDPENGNKATVVLDDLSVSPDFDYLAKRVWEYRYDSDNDGNFVEEGWITISSGNLDRVSFYPSEIGRYEIRLTVTEEFGQPTIDDFVTASDRQTANTDAQSSIERIVTVYNRKPVTDWSW